MKLFLDTNVWLRYFLRDQEEHFKSCLTLFEYIEQGKIQPYTSSIVFLEIQYVLEKVYEVEKKIVQKHIEQAFGMRKLTIIDKTVFKDAWKLHIQKKVKLSDSLIATQIPSHVILCTFDQALLKLGTVIAHTPREIVGKLTNA